MNVAAHTLETKRRLGAKRQLFSLSLAHFFNDVMTTGLVPALLPLYKQAFHLNYLQAGVILFVSMITSSVCQPIFGMITDKHPKTWFLPVGICLTGFGLTASGFAPAYWILLVLVGLSGIGSGIFHPEAMRGAYMAAGTARGTAQAIIQVGGNFGQACGPLLLPLFLIATGLHGLGWFALVTVGAFALVSSVMPWYKRSLIKNKARQAAIKGKNHPGGLDPADYCRYFKVLDTDRSRRISSVSLSSSGDSAQVWRFDDLPVSRGRRARDFFGRAILR